MRAQGVRGLPGLRIQTWGTRLLRSSQSLIYLDSSLRAFVVFEAGEGDVGEAGGLATLGEGEAGDFAGEDEFAVGDEGHTVGGGEALSAFSNKVDVWRLLQDEAGGVDGVAEAFDAGYAAGFHAAAIHEERVELDAAVGGEKAAAACVKCGVILKDSDSGLNGVEGGAAAGEDGVSGFEGAADAGLVGFGSVGGDGPCSAVNEKDGVADGLRWHGVMVTQAPGVRRARAPAVRQPRLAPQRGRAHAV